MLFLMAAKHWNFLCWFVSIDPELQNKIKILLLLIALMITFKSINIGWYFDLENVQTFSEMGLLLLTD